MENVKIILENGIEKNVNGIFYLYNSKYYFIYTEKEVDQNGYVVLHLVQVGKEIKNTQTGPVETGYMIGVEISDQDEWGKVQQSITKIVEDKKNNTQSTDIQYLPISMLNNLKIISKKTFRLMKNIIEDAFKVSIDESVDTEKLHDSEIPDTVASEPATVQSEEKVDQPQYQSSYKEDDDVIIDYRSRFFEEQEKNENLQKQIDELNQKLESIRKILE